MTIIHIINSIAGGGAEQMVYQLSKRSYPKYKTSVVSLSNKRTLEPKFKNHNIPLHYLGISSFKNSSLIKGLKILKDLTKENKNDMVFHCHQYYAGLLGILFKIFINQNVPIVFTLHTNKLDAFIRRLVLFLSKPLRRKDVIFSKSSKKWYLKNNAIIPNGVEFNSPTSNSNREFSISDTFNFLFLGRLNKPKNPLFLVTLVERLIQNNTTNFVIQIVGDGNLLKPLLNEIEKKNLISYFNFHGYQENTKPFIEDSHCLILPSIREGMPMVILEAAADYLPIIATPVGSIPDFLNNNNSYISELDNFHLAMLNVKNDYKSATMKSELLLSDIKSQFNIESVYEKHLQIYRSIVN